MAKVSSITSRESLAWSDRHQVAESSAPCLQIFSGAECGRPRHCPCLLFDEAVNWVAIDRMNEREARGASIIRFSDIRGYRGCAWRVYRRRRGRQCASCRAGACRHGVINVSMGSRCGLGPSRIQDLSFDNRGYLRKSNCHLVCFHHDLSDDESDKGCDLLLCGVGV